MNEYRMITTKAIKDRYAATLAEQNRRRHAAIHEWTRLRWWEWRKRRRLHHELFGIGGWRMNGLDDTDLPERVVLTRVYRRGFRVRVLRGYCQAK